MGETTNEVRSADEFEDPVIRRAPVASESHTSGTEGANDGGPEAAQIRSDIEHTRADLSETINALQEKLDPTRIAEQVKDQIREKATEAYDTAKTAVKEATIGKAEKIVSNVSEAVTDMTGRAGSAIKSSSAVQYIRDNPIPFALVGIGMGMLALNARKKDQLSYSSGRKADFNVYSSSGMGNASATDQPSITDRARSAVSGVADTARVATERATSAVSSAASSVRDVASSAADTASQKFNQGTRVVGDRYNNMLQENPMALGVVALAAGALVGMVLPGTRVEGEYLGEARDRLVDQAKSVAQEAVGKVQRVTEEAGRTLKEAAQKEGLVGGDNPTA
ncbi:MAG: DUF3618 domain-containing protein [Acidobacteriaceae bacterium]|nr:DUF3618 domain-containing protein [Acidobacteriaceae bacterium]